MDWWKILVSRLCPVVWVLFLVNGQKRLMLYGAANRLVLIKYVFILGAVTLFGLIS